MLLLVAGHVYGLNPDTGLRQPSGTLGHYLTDSFEPLRMPLFTVISGFVYALRPVGSTADLPRLVRGKARRLLVPLVPLTALVGGLQLVAGLGNGGLTVADVARGYLYGYSSLWFLYAIFIVFVVVGVLDARGLLASPRTWSLAWLASALTYVLVLLPSRFDVFSTNGALRLLPFFLLGLALRRHASVLQSRRATQVALAVLVPSLAVAQYVVITDAAVPRTGSRALDVVVGTAGLVCLFRVRSAFRWRLLAWIGTYAFTIYLLHTVAAAGARFALDAVGVASVAVSFAVAGAAAITLPVLFHVTAGRIGIVRTVVLGERPRARVAPTPMTSGPATGDTAVREEVRRAA